MWLKLKFILLFILLIFSTISCSTKMDEEQFHEKLIDLHSFYHHYFENFASKSSTAEELTKWNNDFILRKKNDIKTLKQMKETELDDELCLIYEDIISKIEINNEHLYKEIITIKSKEVFDLEDTSKLNRFYRDTKKYYKGKEELFLELYYKFIRRNEIESNHTIHQLKEQSI